MTKVRTFLWFDREAKEAADFYCSVVKDSKILNVTYATDAMGDQEGEVLTVDFELGGHRVMALNAGPNDAFNTSMSIMIETKDQAETDYYWNALIADGGEAHPCGWLKDKYGVFWQVTPAVLQKMLNDPDRAAASRVTSTMLKMGKIVIADLEKAYAGKAAA
jgi:predicted 3-demethylubiquinone-9 3-methyltransferase (glyoxalase superfamily)